MVEPQVGPQVDQQVEVLVEHIQVVGRVDLEVVLMEESQLAAYFLHQLEALLVVE